MVIPKYLRSSSPLLFCYHISVVTNLTHHRSLQSQRHFHGAIKSFSNGTMAGAEPTGRAATSSTAAPQPLTEFHLFPEIPYDIRFLIWKTISCQSRILEWELVKDNRTDSLSPGRPSGRLSRIVTKY
jgi:hypothetical protein